jgi:hypothetical protein
MSSILAGREEKERRAVVKNISSSRIVLLTLTYFWGSPYLSYSSLALTDALWYNLVLFGRADDRTARKNSAPSDIVSRGVFKGTQVYQKGGRHDRR